MHIKLITIGKTDEAYLKQGISKYTDRLKHYVPFLIVELPEQKISNAHKNNAYLLKKEEELLLKNINTSDILVLLDENGKTYNSVEFSQFVELQMINSIKTLVFVVGGAFGFSDHIKKTASYQIALSKLTFTHQMVRLIFVEQLYRAFTIIKGQAYHNI